MAYNPPLPSLTVDRLRLRRFGLYSCSEREKPAGSTESEKSGLADRRIGSWFSVTSLITLSALA